MKHWCLLAVLLPGLAWQADVAYAATDAQLAKQRSQFLSAWQLARRGQDWRAAAQGLESYALWSYLEAAGLRHAPARQPLAPVQSFLTIHGETPQGQRLRSEALTAWAQAGRWSDFLAIYSAPAQASGALACHAWTARHQSAPQTLEALREAARLWRATPRAESACALAFAALEAYGQLADEQRLERIRAAFAAGDLKLVGWLLPKLSPAARVLPTRELALRQSGVKAFAHLKQWPDDAAHRALLAAALVRLAAADPRAAEVWRLKLTAQFKFDAADQLAIQRAIALAAAIDNLDEAAGWLQRIAIAAFDDPRLYEWAARYWLGRGQLTAAEAVLLTMPEALLAQPKWRYLQARVLELNGKAEAAQAAYAKIASDTGFYPFLAADRLDRPYAICPQPYAPDAGLQAELAADPAVKRLLELYAVDLRDAAGLELKALAERLDAMRRVQLAGLLHEHKRYAETITLLGSSPEFQRYYTLRFPFPWRRTIARNAKAQQLDVGWTTALIRAESAFNRHARSIADARGLMQVMPGTARHLDRVKTTPDLFAPAVNLRLGTRYLRLQTERFNGDPIATTAAYNAGPGAVTRWQAKASHQWRDLWVETMPYYETRDYVARVLAFSVIYDWRDDGQLTRLGARLGLLPATPVRAACPTPP